jgi:hypothetical protein
MDREGFSMSRVAGQSGSARKRKVIESIGQVALLAVIMLVPLAACSTGTGGAYIVSFSPTSTPGAGAPPAQQPLPKGLLNATYPVMDWVFNRTCGLAVNSYSLDQMSTTIAYDSAAWLYPSDGHLVQGWQDCAQQALIRQARSQGLTTLLTVGVDSYWSARDLARYIDRATSQTQVPCSPQAATYICNIVNWAVAGGYRGVIIDFESVAWNYPNIRQKFGTFMQDLQDALHQKGLLCGITLISKTSDSPQNPSYKYNYFQDWKLLSRMDFLIPMMLDFDLEVNKPGPITSVTGIEKQIAYLWQNIPQALSKTIFELPLYGREWQEDAKGHWHSINDETCSQVSDQKASEHLLPAVSTDSTTPGFAWKDQNGNRHEVWYESASSLIAIMTRIQSEVRSLLNNPDYKLPTSFWYRGAECANFFGAGNALEVFYKSH